MKAVLTADATLSAGFDLLFDAMLAASQTTTSPPLLAGPLLLPAGAGTLPLGLRRVEAALLEGGWEVRAVPPEGLAGALDADTEVIGLSTGDPLGRGMNSTTMSAVAGGASWPSHHFAALLARVRRLRAAAPRARVVVGGPGAWQLAGDAAARERLGVDHVVLGHCEAGIARQLRELSRLPPVFRGEAPAPEAVPAIRGPALCGSVELSRGCGLGCDFCLVSGLPMRHLPAERVLADARVNLASGRRHLALLSEDVFRYGARGRDLAPAALIDLAHRLRAAGAGLLQPDHGNLSSVAAWSDDDLALLRRELAGGPDWVWINVGVETPDGRLLAQNGGKAKLGDCPPEQWGGHCARQLGRLCRAGWLPFASLVIGLEGEEPSHVEAAIAWVESLPQEPLAVFPMLLAPMDAPWARPRLTRRHWDLMRACYRRNFRWIPGLVAQQQRAAGVGALRRGVVQVLGRGQMLQWKALFAWHRSRAS